MDKLSGRTDLSGINGAKRPVFFCSFGKDSSVVLHMLKDYLDSVQVVFVDCGGIYPDVVEWADRIGSSLPHYTHIHALGDIWQEIKDKGWPVDIELDEIGELSNVISYSPLAKTNRVRLWTKCVKDRIWTPAVLFNQLYRSDLYISGEKLSDRPYATDWDQRHMGAGKAFRPIANWTDQNVWDYIDAHDIKLPKSFTGRQADRRDCYVCFGNHLTTSRVEYLRSEYPDLYNKIFNELGFKDIVSSMVKHLAKSHETWTAIEKLIQE
jgi:3'-phosphoadenosine 5'-phosphosulfate sulfotransferase (PAPS reductase)/FAD synthetase